MIRDRTVRFVVAGVASAGVVLGGCGDDGPTRPENRSPNASISSPSGGATFTEGTDITFEGTASDPDQGTLSGSALTWASDLDGELGEGASVTRNDLSVGDHSVTLTATDDAGATGTATVSITVEENQAPSASIASPSDGATIDQSAPIEFRGSAEDPEEGALTGDALVWTSDVTGRIGTGESFTRSDLCGAQEVTLEATDSQGTSSKTSVNFTVEGAPSAAISSPANETIVQKGSMVSLQGSADDPTDGPLSGGSLVWTSDRDGKLGTGVSVSVSELSHGGHTITLTATDSGGCAGSTSVEILIDAPQGFQIQAREVDGVTSGERSTLDAALARWEGIITGDVSSGFLPAPSDSFPDDANRCLDTAGGVDDLLVCVYIEDIDGSGGTLAQAGPFFKRTADGLPIMGLVFIDQADRRNAQLEEILVHEVGHVLGIGVPFIDGWGADTVDVQGTNDPFFDGSGANAAFDDLGGEAYLSDGVPLENQFGGGTRGAHWRDLNFNNELMTGIINQGQTNPISSVTIGALADIGFTVDPSQAESYTLPMPQTALWEADADATLVEPASSGDNFGAPDGSTLSGSIVAGANDGGTWPSVPDGEFLTGLVRFDVPSAPLGVTITTAALRLFQRRVDAGSMSHEIEVVRANESWSEGTVTWDGRPSFGGSPVATFAHDSCLNQNYCVQNTSDLLDLVQGWADGSTENHGLALRAPDAGSDPTFSLGFWSREAGAPTQRPEILIRAEAGGASLRAGLARPGGGLPMINDIRDGPVYGLTPDGRVVTPDGRTLRPAPSP